MASQRLRPIHGIDTGRCRLREFDDVAGPRLRFARREIGADDLGAAGEGRFELLRFAGPIKYGGRHPPACE